MTTKPIELEAFIAEHGLTFEAFSRINRQRCESPQGFNHQLDSWSTSDWFLAMLGELGEAANIAKKLNRVRDGIPGNKQTPEELRTRLRQELGDVYVYLDLIAQALGFQIGDAAVEVFNAKSEELNCPIRIPISPEKAAPEPRVDELNASRERLAQATRRYDAAIADPDRAQHYECTEPSCGCHVRKMEKEFVPSPDQRPAEPEGAAFGTAECPICGKEGPHAHPELEQKGYIVALNISNEINRRGMLALHELSRVCGFHLAEYERKQSATPTPLSAQLAGLREALEEAHDLIEGYVDVKDGDNGPIPNNAMKAIQVIDDARDRIKKVS